MRLPALILATLVGAAFAAPAIVRYPPDHLDLDARRQAPSAAHWFGTDDLGRDVVARVLYGARVSLGVGLLSAVVAGISGTGIGGVAGYAGGALDALLMRGTDAMLAVPRLPLLMIAASILQPTVGVLVRPPAADRVRVRPRLAAFVGPHVAWNGTVRGRHDGRRHRSRATPAAAGHRAGGRAGSGVVTVSSRVDD